MFEMCIGVLTKGWPSVLTEEAGDLIRNALSASENKALATLSLHNLFEMLDHAITLFEVGNDLDDLSDTVVSGQVH